MSWSKNQNRCQINCITIYRPHRGKIDNCLKSLNAFILDTVRHKEERITLHGDFNINYLNPNCKWTKELKNFELKTGLHQLIKIPTRISHLSSSCIDLCFTDLKFISSSGVLNVNISDRLPIYLIRKTPREHVEKCSFLGRNYKNLTADKISSSIKKHLPSFGGWEP